MTERGIIIAGLVMAAVVVALMLFVAWRWYRNRPSPGRRLLCLGVAVRGVAYLCAVPEWLAYVAQGPAAREAGADALSLLWYVWQAVATLGLLIALAGFALVALKEERWGPPSESAEEARP